jgi:hypothetical protein
MDKDFGAREFSRKRRGSPADLDGETHQSLMESPLGFP